MSKSGLEVADIFRKHGSTWRKTNAGHISLGQMKVMSAIEHCRTAELGGHVERCADCSHTIMVLSQTLSLGKLTLFMGTIIQLVQQIAG